MTRGGALPPGETFGRYRLLEPIGRGGMADVYKAKSFGVEGFEKVLVIKRIVPELAAHQAFVDMFVREAKLAVQLSHANIVQVFDLGRIDHDARPSDYFIAMEYVAGVDLATVLDHYRRHKERLPLPMAVFVAAEVAKALDHAHRRHGGDNQPLGIVHRDISPQNILLSWDGDVKVTDFGIAKAADAIAAGEQHNELEAAKATGKISFMSPEQSRSEKTDARSDLFSLGSVLYQMITGANPFTAPTVSETIRRINAGEYPPIALARPETPPALAAVADKLLAASPEQRFAGAAELYEQLVAYSYTSGQRFGATDLASALAPLREGPDPLEIEAARVFDEPSVAGDQTPVEIPNASTPPAAPSAPDVGERREVTLLVLSFGRREPAGASAALLAHVREVLERHGAWLEEETPTQVVAIFGLGDTDGRDAEAGVRAAMVLVRERRDGAVPSAGVHSGAISVDVGGLPMKDERLASLLATTQALARATEGQVSISQLTGRLVRRSFATEPLGQSSQGESARALAEGALVVRGARAAETKRRFVGRHEELKRLGGILAAATRHRTQLAALQGDTGLGKSRLLGEAKRRLERGHFNVAFYATSCPLNGANMPWSGLRAILQVLCGTEEGDAPTRILEVRPRLRALGLSDEQAAAVLGLLGAPLPSDAGEMRAHLPAAFERMVVSLCRDRLHCFAWDDAHAFDRESLDSVLRVVRRQPSLRAVLLIALRGEVPKRFAKHPGVHLDVLEELHERETARFLEEVLGARSVPPALLSYVRSCAGGHPLFIEELVRELCDTGVVQVLSGIVTVKTEAQPVAPRPLRTLIADRVSRLPQRERRVLQGVAILGEPSFTPVLASVLEAPLPGLDRHLASLESRGLLRRTGPTRVRFASPLYAEIVLDSMPLAARQELHARAANTYENAEAPTAGDTAERTAQHWLEAGDRQRAVDSFWRAARERLTMGQHEAGLHCMLRGLELATVAERHVPELCEWLASLASTVSRVRQASGLREALAPALREIEARGELVQRVRAQIDVARALGAVNLFDDAHQALERAGVEGIGDDTELEQARLIAQVELSARQGLFARAADAADRLEALGPLEDTRALLVMSLARAGVGQCDKALELLERVDTLSPPASAADAVARQKQRLLVHFNRRDFEASVREAQKLVGLARAAGLRFDAAAALHNLGDACDRLGDHPRAYAAFVESLDLCRQMEHERLTNLNQMHLCLLDGLRRVEGAEERLKGHIRFADGKGYLWDVLEGRLCLARVSAARGDKDAARQQLSDVLTMARDHGHELIARDASDMLAGLA